MVKDVTDLEQNGYSNESEEQEEDDHDDGNMDEVSPDNVDDISVGIEGNEVVLPDNIEDIYAGTEEIEKVLLVEAESPVVDEESEDNRADRSIEEELSRLSGSFERLSGEVPKINMRIGYKIKEYDHWQSIGNQMGKVKPKEKTSICAIFKIYFKEI